MNIVFTLIKNALPAWLPLLLLINIDLVWGDHAGVLNDTETTPNEDYFVEWTDDNPYNPDTDGNGTCDVRNFNDIPAGSDLHYFPAASAQSVLDAFDNNNPSIQGSPNGNHWGFLDLGFATDDWRSPTSIFDCSNHSYNSDGSNGCDSGQANSTMIRLPAPQWICDSDAALRLLVGHELFHHVQYEADLSTSKWTKALMEGTARMMQDQVYTDLDGDGGSDGCCLFTWEADDYLQDTNRNLFSSDVSYEAALFWKYAAEQFGAWAAEPNLGTDFIVRMFNRADNVSSDLEDLVEKTIQETHPDRNIDDVFLDFSIANIAKEYNVSNLTDAIRYMYQDEQDGVSSPYANVNRTWSGSPNKNASDEVSRWGAHYYEADLVNCPNGIAGFRSRGDRAGYGLLVIRQDGAVDRLFKGISESYAKSIILSRENDTNPIRRLVAISSGLGSDADYEYDFACGQATLEIIRPNSSYLAYVGKHDNPERFTVRLKVQGPSELGTPTVQGLDSSDFEIYVDSVDPSNSATIISGSEVQGEYWLVAQAPTKMADGDFNLVVKLRDIATDSKSLAIRYEEKLLDQVIVVDRSGSMMSPAGFTKMEAVRNAASILADAAGSTSQISSVSFGGNNNEVDDDATLDELLKLATDSHRSDVKAAITGIADPAGTVMTSIGDGLETARNEFIVRGTTIGEDVITLLSDGMENEGLYVADVLPSLVSQGIEVNSIALGPQADQPLLQSLASQTGGTFYYVDVGTSAGSGMASSSSSMSALAATSTASYPLQLRLADTYLSSYEAASDSERIKESFGSMGAASQNVNFLIEESQIEDGRVTVAWSDSSAIVDVKVHENNSLLVDGVNGVEIFNGDAHAEIQLPAISQGSLDVEITSTKSISYFAAISGKPINGANMSLAFDQVLDPDVLSEGGTFKYGKPIRIVAFINEPGSATTDVNVIANIKHPGGTIDELPLFDDGAHHDGQANDGVYAAVYRRTTIASPTGLADGATPNIMGSYNVVAEASGNTKATSSRPSEQFSRIIKSSFNIFEGQETVRDIDGDTMPDAYEKSLPCLNEAINDAGVDFDNDGLINRDEWQGGTNPCEQDTDFGGIHDGSERILGLNPFDPADDYLPTPRMVEVVERSSEHQTDDVQLMAGAVTIRYPTNVAYQTIRIYRSMSAAGPFTMLSEFSPDGSSIYRDQTGVIGTTYYYRVQALGTSNAETAWSPVVRGMPKADPNPPIGNVAIAEGAVVNSSSVTIKMFSDHSDTSHFRIKNIGDVSFSPWIPFTGSYPWVLQTNSNSQGVVVVQYKDGDDNLSLKYKAGAKVVASSLLGEVQGSVTMTGSAPSTIEGRVRVTLTDNLASTAELPPVYTDASGVYRLGSVPEGGYILRIAYSNQEPIELNVSVVGGAITTAPNQSFHIMVEENVPLLTLWTGLALAVLLTIATRVKRRTVSL